MSSTSDEQAPRRRSQAAVAKLSSTKPDVALLEVARCEVANTTSKSPGISPSWCVVLLAIVIWFFSLIRIRLLNLPLERDEGEYAYSGQLMLQGIAPYSLAYNMKLPGTYAAYVLIMAAFGESPGGVHAGLLLANVATVILLFLLAKKLFGPLAGLAAGSSYALLSTSESVLGLAGHANSLCGARGFGRSFHPAPRHRIQEKFPVLR
jgi:hypothetical protein